MSLCGTMQLKALWGEVQSGRGSRYGSLWPKRRSMAKSLGSIASCSLANLSFDAFGSGGSKAQHIVRAGCVSFSFN